MTPPRVIANLSRMLLPASRDELRELLRSCLAVSRWVDDVAAGAPFATPDALIQRAYTAATPLSPAEIEQALTEHPRIGEPPAGDDRPASFSRFEQQAPDAADATINAAIAQGNAAYEARFGRVFLIRAAGRSRADILAELHRRLELDDDTDRAIVGRELRDITVLRLQRLLQQGAEQRSQVTTHVLDASSGVPASGVVVVLEHLAAAGSTHSPGWEVIARRQTDDDGRIEQLGPVVLPPGRYRLTFVTADYFAARNQASFYPEVIVSFELSDPAAHYHVPLLLSPFAYSTYRGS